MSGHHKHTKEFDPKFVRNLTTMTVQHTSMIFFSLLIRDLTKKFSNNVESIFHTFFRMILYAHFI